MNLETTFYFWSIILTIAALVLFVEAIALIRFFLRHRRPWWQRLLVLLPLGVSVWSIIAVFRATPSFNYLFPPGIHFSLATYLAWLAPYRTATIHDQIQAAICAAVFILTLVIERIFQVRYNASSQYNANARFVSHLARSIEVPMQASARQRWEIQSRGRR